MVTGNTYERVLRTMKRVFVGAAVKSCRRSKTGATFGHRKRAAEEPSKVIFYTQFNNKYGVTFGVVLKW